jgi:metal-sulfur cluster biosynthetic enzyme
MSPVSDTVRLLAAQALDDGDGVPAADTEDGTAPPDAAADELFADLELEADAMPSVELLRGALRAVIDPEIGYNIVDLGLVYAVTKPARGQVRVEMTLTSIGCPLADVIDAQVRMVLLALPGVEMVDLRFTFTPPWTTARIADWVKEELLAMGMHL